MRRHLRLITTKITLLALVISLLSLISPLMTPLANAATVTASGPHASPSVCNQTVGNSDSVVAYRLADGACVVEFKRTGTTTWTTPNGVSRVWALVIAGGGGGGGDEGGGGGAGGYLEETSIAITAGTSMNVTVGDGGVGGNSNTTRGSNGGTSSFSTMSASGGGGGGTAANSDGSSPSYVTLRKGQSGGSGGGGAGEAPPQDGGTGIAGPPRQGYNGGTSLNGATDPGAGGGGAGEAGDTDGESLGGDGKASSITGTSVFRAGGGHGGGGNSAARVSATPSDGGGGLGGGTSGVEGTAGEDGKGGGGGGAGGSTLEGLPGGSGIVIIRYTPDTTAPSTSVSISATYLTSGTSVSTVLATNETLSSVTLYYSTSASLTSPQSCGTTSNPTNGQTLTCTIASSDATYYIYSLGTDSAGNIETAPVSADDSIIRDTTAPTVTNVSSSVADGRYGIESVIPIRVTFSETVTASLVNIPQSSLRLTVETGVTDRTAYYSSGSGSTTLVLNYTVQAGDNNPDLDYVLITSLYLVAGTVQDAAGNNASLTLPTPGASGSLGANKNIIIDTTAPSLLSASVSAPGNSIVLTYNETLSATAPDISRFLISDSGTSLAVTAALTSGPELTLTTSSTIRAGRVVTLSYVLSGTGVSGNLIMDLATNFAAYFDDQSVTNNSAVLNSLTTPTTLALTTRDTSTATFTYTNTTNASSHTLRLYDSATSTLLSTTTSFTSGSTRTGLSPATQYYATLQAVGDGITYESSTASTPIYFTTLIRPPTITSSPQETATTVTRSARFAVGATSADAGSLTYQWQVSTDAGASFSNLSGVNISGATTATLTLSSLTLAENGYQYRVVITATKNGVSATETSTAVALTVNGAISLSGGSAISTTYGVAANSAPLSASGGTGSITYSIAPSTSGITINTATGVVSTSSSAARVSTNLTITATDAVGASATQSISVTIATGTSTISLSLSAAPRKGGAITLTATTSWTGTVAFRAKGRVITGCANRSVNAGTLTATCTWKPIIHGPQALRASYTSSNADWGNAATSVETIVLKRVSR